MNKKCTFEAAEPIHIKPYDESKDTTFVMSIINEHPKFLSYEFAGKPPGTTEKYLTQKNHYTFMLYKNDKPIGFINFFIKEKNNYKVGSIDLFGIDNNNQKKGYGLLLVEYALKKLKEFDVSEVSLIVNKENKKAQKLYEKIGFVANSKSDSLRVWNYIKKI